MAEKDLFTWYQKKDRKPLIIRGARQVGKSTLVKLFCERNNLSLLEINLEKLKLISVTTDDFKIDNMLDEIQIKTKKIIDEKTIVFFDEIQESPKLLSKLRYFYEEAPHIAIISAGSLLEVILNHHEFSFPVGRVEFYNLGPMNFTEFLWATDNNFLYQKISEKKFSLPVIKMAQELLQKFYYIGGMPKAIKTYVEEKSLVPVREVQNQIIETYLADFPKYNSRIKTQRIEKIFYSSVNFLGKKIIWNKIDPESKARDTRRIVELLIDARVLISCTHSDANKVPLKGEESSDIFKLYFLDVGLLNAIFNLDFYVIDNEMKNDFNSKGIIAEQFVAQHLAYKNPLKRPELFYWLRDKTSQKAEVDFVVEKGDEIIPIEVKARKAGHLKSLFYFLQKKDHKRAIKISLDDFKISVNSHKINDSVVEINLYNIPQYAIGEIDSILNTLET